jgi:hypothetical protein
MINKNQYIQSKTIRLFSPHHWWQTNCQCYYCHHSCNINLSSCQLNKHKQCPSLRPQEKSHGVKLGGCSKWWSRPTYQPGKFVCSTTYNMANSIKVLIQTCLSPLSKWNLIHSATWWGYLQRSILFLLLDFLLRHSAYANLLCRWNVWRKEAL